jgi:predicted lipoprotein with Yx(FWY)xxD motif
MSRLYRPAALVVPIAALLLAACQAGAGSPSGQASSAPSTPASVAEEPSASAAESMAPQADATVVVATAASVGDYLTDADGNTVYVFLNDSPGATSCFDSCLQTWPPLTVAAGTEPSAGDGVSGELGTIERSDDGSLQVTLDNRPLYYFAGDAAAGDTNGEGVGNVWFVARPDGSVQGGAATLTSSPYSY